MRERYRKEFDELREIYYKNVPKRMEPMITSFLLIIFGKKARAKAKIIIAAWKIKRRGKNFPLKR